MTDEDRQEIQKMIGDALDARFSSEERQEEPADEEEFEQAVEEDKDVEEFQEAVEEERQQDAVDPVSEEDVSEFQKDVDDHKRPNVTQRVSQRLPEPDYGVADSHSRTEVSRGIDAGLREDAQDFDESIPGRMEGVPSFVEVRHDVHVMMSTTEDFSEQIARAMEPKIQGMYEQIRAAVEDSIDRQSLLLEQGRTIE